MEWKDSIGRLGESLALPLVVTPMVTLRIQEAWQESVEWWSKVYKVTWSDQPQNVYAFAFALLTSVTIVIIRYNLLAIGASFIVVVVSLILGSRHITRTMEEEGEYERLLLG